MLKRKVLQALPVSKVPSQGDACLQDRQAARSPALGSLPTQHATNSSDSGPLGGRCTG